MNATWKNFTKVSQVRRSIPTVSGEAASRIDNEARLTGKLALRAPTKKELLRQYYSRRDKDKITPKGINPVITPRAGDPDYMLGQMMNPILIAPFMSVGGVAGVPSTLGSTVAQSGIALGVSKALDELGKRDRRLASSANLAMVSAPFITSLVKKYPWVSDLPKPSGKYDSGRLNTLLRLAKLRGFTPRRKMLVGNLSKTDPALVDSDVVISAPRRKMLNLLDKSIEGNVTSRAFGGSALREALGRGYETWPSSSIIREKNPNVFLYDNRYIPRGGKERSIRTAVSYGNKADAIKSITTPGDSMSPTSGRVIEELSKGKTPEQIISRWLDESPYFRRYYTLDDSSGNRIVPESTFADIKRFGGDENAAQTWIRDHIYKLRKTLPPDETGFPPERKFVGDVPMNADVVDGAFLSSGFNPRMYRGFGTLPSDYGITAKTLNRAGIPFAGFPNVNRRGMLQRWKDGVEYLKSRQNDYEALFGSDLPAVTDLPMTAADRRAIRVWLGGLNPLRIDR